MPRAALAFLAALAALPANAADIAPRIQPRSAWGAAEIHDGIGIRRQYRRDIAPARITIHHTGLQIPEDQKRLAAGWLGLPPDARAQAMTLSQAVAAEHLRKVQQLHFSKGWTDIGYHYMIDWMGRIYEGRPVGTLGAHTEDANRGNIGIALLGDLEREEPGVLQEAALERLVLWLAKRYKIAPDQIKGHRDYANTACPGERFYAKLQETRRKVAADRLEEGAFEPKDAIQELLKPWAPGSPVLADSRLAQRMFDGLLPR